MDPIIGGFLHEPYLYNGVYNNNGCPSCRVVRCVPVFFITCLKSESKAVATTHSTLWSGWCCAWEIEKGCVEWRGRWIYILSITNWLHLGKFGKSLTQTLPKGWGIHHWKMGTAGRSNPKGFVPMEADGWNQLASTKPCDPPNWSFR